jgi:Spy/CpxP family protein refolding chaperone
MKKVMGTIGVMALLVGSSFAQEKMATEPVRMHNRGELKEKEHHDRMADIPNLTEAQKEQIKAIQQEGRKKSEPQRKEMKELRTKLDALKTAENPDQKQINQLIDKSALMKAEMEKSKAESELKVRSILTPEQRKAVDAKHKEHMEMRENKKGERKEYRDAK